MEADCRGCVVVLIIQIENTTLGQNLPHTDRIISKSFDKHEIEANKMLSCSYSALCVQDFVPVPQTVFTVTIKQTLNDAVCCGRMCENIPLAPQI